MTDRDPLPIPDEWWLDDRVRDSRHPLIQAAAAVADATTCPVIGYSTTRYSFHTTRYGLVVPATGVVHDVPLKLRDELSMIAPIYAYGLRRTARELVAVAAVLNAEAERLEPSTGAATTWEDTHPGGVG